MIDPKQIPDEVVEALWKQMGSFFSREEARTAIIAVLSAWPGMEQRRVTDYAIPPMPECLDRTMAALILPLPQEPRT